MIRNKSTLNGSAAEVLDCKPSHDSYSKVADRQWLQRHAATQRPADRARPHFGRLSSTLADLPNAADVSNVADVADALQLPSPA